MKNKFVLKKCLICGKIVRVIEEGSCQSCNISCCGESMFVVKENSTDAAIEKHIPIYDLKENKVTVRVNHVMDQDHFIEWICLKTADREEFVYLKAGEDAIAVFENVQLGTLYAYCNKHGLWSVNIGSK